MLSRGDEVAHVIVEAQAAALPVIATADSGTLDQIEGGLTGPFVPYDDPPAVASAGSEHRCPADADYSGMPD